MTVKKLNGRGCSISGAFGRTYKQLFRCILALFLFDFVNTYCVIVLDFPYGCGIYIERLLSLFLNIRTRAGTSSESYLTGVFNSLLNQFAKKYPLFSLQLACYRFPDSRRRTKKEAREENVFFRSLARRRSHLDYPRAWNRAVCSLLKKDSFHRL